MLSALSIRNVVLIETLDLEFERGFTVLTGETGAGKSIILDALGMATGSRSDRGLVRSGTDKATCVASFFLPEDHPVFKILADAEIDVDSQSLDLRRVINSDGRSRAFINDMPVSVKLLGEIGALVLEVHGQHDGRGLLDASTHITLLDIFSGHDELLANISELYRERAESEDRLARLIAESAKSQDEREFLSHAVAEIDRLDPKMGEEATLASRRKFLQGAETALSELSAAESALSESGAFEDRLALALAGIERVRSRLTGAGTETTAVLDNAANALEKSMLETQEAREAVNVAARTFDVEPGELDKAEQRLFALRAASRKYDVEIDGLIDKRAEFAEQLMRIDNFDAELKAAKSAAESAKKQYENAAAVLTAKRKTAAKALDKNISGELPPLKMEQARFQTIIEPGNPGPSGQDKVSFVVATNRGSEPGPLQKVASGGELARMALAIKVALAARNQSVMVFDEVDQGVSGAVADAVGRRLGRLSETSQVFCVTHSPQVAACADHQFRIEKSSTGVTTTTQVCHIEAGDREEEIARMLAGESVTQEARAAARKLMRAS